MLFDAAIHKSVITNYIAGEFSAFMYAACLNKCAYITSHEANHNILKCIYPYSCPRFKKVDHL